MANYFPPTIAQARTQSTQVSVTATPQSQPKLWETELFQLSAMGAVVALLMLWASISKKQPKLTTARMANRWDKLNATNLTFKHLQVTASGKCNPSAGWCGTPQYKYKFLGEQRDLVGFFQEAIAKLTSKPEKNLSFKMSCL